MEKMTAANGKDTLELSDVKKSDELVTSCILDLPALSLLIPTAEKHHILKVHPCKGKLIGALAGINGSFIH